MANTEVALLQQAGGAKVSTRGTYLKMSSEKKVEIGKRAAEHGVLATVRYYAHRLQLFADSFRDHRYQVKCMSHTSATSLIMHLDYAEFTQTLIHVK